MNILIYFLVLLAIPVDCLADGVIPAVATEDSSATRLLLLRNGGVLEGQVTKQDNLHYLVKLHDGQIRVRAADVEFICRDLEEAYQRKKRLAQGGNLENHLQLARWCQQQGMAVHAAEELAAVEAIAPRHPMLPLLKRKLETAQKPPGESKPHPAADSSPSGEELDRMIRGLPPITVEQYTRSVQPLLLNNCSAGRCHGPQSTTNFRLLRAPPDQLASRRLTQRNLYAVLQYIDQENPASSRLLTVPTGPHGNLKTPIFNERQADQYQMLVDWVAEFDPAAMPPSLAPIPSHTALASSKSHLGEVIPASHEEPLPDTDAPTPKNPGSHPPPPKPLPKVKHGADRPQFSPQDEFDPEIFNRRYFGPPRPPADSSPPSS